MEVTRKVSSQIVVHCDSDCLLCLNAYRSLIADRYYHLCIHNIKQGWYKIFKTAVFLFFFVFALLYVFTALAAFY